MAFESRARRIRGREEEYLRADVFVHDRQTGVTTHVSVSSNGVGGNSDSQSPSISEDGRFVAFESLARNLVAGDDSWGQNVFIHDRQTSATTRVSVSSNGAEGNGGSQDPSISGDGRFVAFYSWANNLVAGDNNNAADIFVAELNWERPVPIQWVNPAEEARARFLTKWICLFWGRRSSRVLILTGDKSRKYRGMSPSRFPNRIVRRVARVAACSMTNVAANRT